MMIHGNSYLLHKVLREQLANDESGSVEDDVILKDFQ